MKKKKRTAPTVFWPLFPFIQNTGTCALGQLRADKDTTLSEILFELSKLKEQHKQKWDPTTMGGGQTAVFCVTTHFENSLAEKLKLAEFKPVLCFPRRNGYNPGVLTLWVRVV